MMSLRERKWIDGVLNPHLYKLIPRQYSRYEHLLAVHKLLIPKNGRIAHFRLLQRELRANQPTSCELGRIAGFVFGMYALPVLGSIWTASQMIIDRAKSPASAQGPDGNLARLSLL